MKPKKMILCFIPNNKCNFKCDYCFLSQIPEWIRHEESFFYSVEHIAKCLSSKRLGGSSLINITGEGETLLQPGIVDLCRLLLVEGHYIELVTNLTIVKVVDDFMQMPRDLLNHLEFKVSFHYNELKRLNLIERFFENIKKIRNAGCSFTLELMPYDELVPEIDKIISLCEEKVGAKCQVTVGRSDDKTTRGLLSNFPVEKYKQQWGKFESTMFNLKMELLNVKRKEFCYAGDWTLYVNLYSGEASSCYGQPYKQNIFKDPEKPIHFHAVGCHCLEPYCINGHAHIAMGVIPQYECGTYADIRNRTCIDGSQWFSDNCYNFFNSKLIETNKEYSKTKKIYSNILWYFINACYVIKHPRKLLKRMNFYFFKVSHDSKSRRN